MTTGSRSRVPTRFPTGCREFLLDLAAHAERTAAPSHARECRSCAARWRAARRQAGLLAGLARSSPPADDADVIAGIFARVHASSPLAGPLAKALEVEPAPRDVAWWEIEPRAETAAAMRGLRRLRAPAWMRHRVRAAVRPAARAEGAPTPWAWRRAGVAAAALVAVWLVVEFAGTNGGTSAPTEIVWNVRPVPADSSFSLHGLMELSR